MSATKAASAGAVLVAGLAATGLAGLTFAWVRNAWRQTVALSEGPSQERPGGGYDASAPPATAASQPHRMLLRTEHLAALSLAMVGFALISVALIHQQPFLYPVGGLWLLAAAIVAWVEDPLSPFIAPVFGAVGLAAGARAFRFGLLHFSSAADFAPALFALVGSAAALAYGGDIVLRRLKGRGWIGPSRGAAVLALLTVVTVALASASIAVTLTGRSGVSAEARRTATSVRMKDIRFEPARLVVAQAPVVRFAVRNDDLILHTFTIDGSGVDAQIGPGSEKLVEFRGLAPGNYTYRCTVPGHDAMRGTLQVTAADGAPASTPAAPDP